MQKIRRAVKYIVEMLGYRIVPKDYDYPKDLREVIDNPLCAKYHARTSSFLLNVPPEKCVMWWRYSCSKDIGNPLVDTIIDYLENGHDTFKDSIMAKYYESFQPNNVAELFDLDDPLSHELTSYPAYSMVLPWKNIDMKTKKNIVERHVKKENKTRGKELSVEHGIQQFGPVSDEKGELEFNRIIELTQSIKQNGYKRSGRTDNDITAVVLVHGDNYKYVIHGGTHRAAVLTALDYQSLPIRIAPSVIPAFVYRNEVEYWAQVKNGLYTVDQALHIFDVIFEGSGVGVFPTEGKNSISEH